MEDYIILNKKQLSKLVEISHHFKGIEHFKISTDSSSGIGPTATVSFNIFADSDPSLAGQGGDTKIDITDVSEW